MRCSCDGARVVCGTVAGVVVSRDLLGLLRRDGRSDGEEGVHCEMVRVRMRVSREEGRRRCLSDFVAGTLGPSRSIYTTVSRGVWAVDNSMVVLGKSG